MDYGTFKEWVRKTGLDLKGFAGLLGMSHGSISNYSGRGEVPRHVALIAVMMVELDRLNVNVDDLIAKLDGPGKRTKTITEDCVKPKRKNAK